MTAGSVVLYATYEWADDLGRRWESAPSDPVTVAVTGSQHVATTITRLTTTAKTGVRVVLWRTTADGTVAYRDTEGSNDGTGAVSLTAGDSSDTTVSGNEILYTMGGVLDNTPFPACEHVALHNERLFFSRCLDTQRVYYTQVLGAAEGWRGSKDYLFTDVADRVVGTASMDDKLVVLAENRPHIVTGQGPNNLGLDNSFFLQPVQEAVQADYAYPRAILSSSMGVWFKSERGLRCLSRGLSLARLGDGQFVGAETDSLVTACVAAVAHPTRPQLWFFVGTGAVAVFDYQWAQWSEFSNFACTHACTYGDSIAFCTSSGTIFQTDTAVWKDNGSAITATIETGWAHVAGIHGFQRIRRAFFTAQDLANAGGDIKIEFAYDGSGTYSSTDAPTVTIAASTTSLSYAHHMAQQKCSRMRIKLTLQGSSGSTVGAFRVAGLGIEVGTKRGGPKLSSGQRL